MSQYKAKALILSLLGASCLATPAMGAVQNPGLEMRPGVTQSDSFPLSLTGQALESARLDWRTPEHRLTFDLPPSDWVETMGLRLLADPIAGAGRAGRDIEVQLNGGEPTLIKLSRRGFTASLPLPVSDVRTGRNELRIKLVGAPGRTCLTEADGGWDIDLTRSRLDTRLEAKSRSVFLSELDAYLARRTVEPRRIRIRAMGADSETHQALIAQGTALRTPSVPRFVLAGSGDVEIIAGTRMALAGTVTDESILDGTGARVAVHEGRPLRLILTGDTEAEVAKSVEAYATHSLPSVRRRITTPQGMLASRALGSDAKEVSRKAKIADLGGLTFSKNWGAGPDEVMFDVADPQGSAARIKLDLERAYFVSDASTVDVTLNGRSLGISTLDADRQTLDMVVPQGWLVGRGNVLRVTPDLQPVAGGCAPVEPFAGLVVGHRSHVRINMTAPSNEGDLSRLSADGGLLAEKRGEGTQVVMPENRMQREQALRVLGRLAKAKGQGLTAASYGAEAPTDKNLLAFHSLPSGVKAPRAVENALGQNARGTVVSLFPEETRWVGLVAPMRGGSMSASVNSLMGPAWDDLSGGVSQIQAGRVDMVQMAYGESVPVVPSIRLPEISLADMQLPTELRLPDVDFGAIAPVLETQVEDSVATLSESWARVDIDLKTPLKFLRTKLAMRGRYDAPRAVALNTYTLADSEGRLSAGLGSDLKRLEAKIARKANKTRRDLGLNKVEPQASWAWGDRNMSIPAILMMISFVFSVFLLTRDSPMTTWRS